MVKVQSLETIVSQIKRGPNFQLVQDRWSSIEPNHKSTTELVAWCSFNSPWHTMCRVHLFLVSIYISIFDCVGFFFVNLLLVANVCVCILRTTILTVQGHK